jgi:hypothetical protein
MRALGRSLALLLLAGAVLAPRAGAAGPPRIPAAWVTGVTATSAVLQAEVDPEGLATRYHFE